MHIFQPKLFTLLKEYNTKQLINDLVAGLIVAIIALPLSIALAIASGVSPEKGLYTAIVAGFLISLFGGSRVNISGPTAAFATIVAGIVATFGINGLIIATIMAGVLLILMGVLKLGGLIKYIPFTITCGFTTGIAVTLVIGQLKDFFGLTYPAGVNPIETMEKLLLSFENFGTLNINAVMIGLISLLILIFWPKINKKIPGSLIAVLVGALMVKFLKLDVKTIGDLYTISGDLPVFAFPEMNLGLIKELLPSAFTIAILAAIESLLSCVVSDGMINDKHNSNTELIAQGIGNIFSGLFGGIPATGAIARTAANVKNGGKTPVAGIVHAIVLLLILVVLMPYASLIPMPVIASILFIVAYNMSNWRVFVKICKTAPKSDILVLVITFVLTVAFDLIVAIEVGIIIALILFMKRMTEVTKVRVWKNKFSDDDRLKNIPAKTAVYEVEGALFFATSEIVTEISADKEIENVIIRMRNVPSLDINALKILEEVYDKLKENGIRIIFSHTNKQPLKVMKKAGFFDKVGEDNFKENIDIALDYVSKN